jgi:hypothetical protein
MTISEAQLERWSHQGAVTTSANTYQLIRNTLLSSTSPIKDKDLDICLQGSYKNDTNIRGDSDVDVVVQLNSIFQPEKKYLSQEELDLYSKYYSNSTYSWSDFRQDVLTLLRSTYGYSSVTEGNKSIKLAADSGRLSADIVVCIQYRLYLEFKSKEKESYLDGVAFWTKNDNRLVINYPKLHYYHGVEKNDDKNTSGMYKPLVRVFKNARTYLVDNGIINKDLAPSYFLECLLSNVDNKCFNSSLTSSSINILSWLMDAKLEGFKCQNHVVNLFGDTPEQWNISDTKRLILEFARLWVP